ncbi:integrin beta-PS isoform X1 [Episyrphus balteatus]|uniref:integrin beta-PS isoform X1 n=1 Tax=Episyrphus balteatus TaxID=286459 RepID=UPI0024863732|nr:integrin beta-PS isoform X1 [Episyrphus balteatus]XP_055842894.1 integrin beta-PS isoform X1 [Episyrphus balteatus]
MTRTSRILDILAIIVLIGCVVIVTEAQIAEKYTQNPCVNKQTCRECIQTQSCAWCMATNFTDKPRCFHPSFAPLGACPEEFTWNPSNERTFIINRELSRASSIRGGGQMVSGGSYEAGSSYSASGSSYQSSQYGASAKGSSSSSSSFSAASGSIVQISPQKVNLKLRINEPYKLNFRYSQAEDYPVDLYYLMDLSKSMEDDKAKLSKLGALLSETMRNITSNFKLGFGSFVDKVLMPYVSTIPKKLEHPCDGCEAPYGYRNHMTLSVDTAKFSKEVEDAAVSGNLDAPEGGFDAIMQAIVCRDRIGWRDQARRLLVFSTDAGFHYAGDGKLGGVIEPNDGQCHLDSSGLYTHSTIQDYPSISQINHHVKKNSINVIFAVTQTQINVYKKLSQHIEGSSSAVLSNDSSNVVDLVRDEYNKISSSIEMKDTASSYVKINYYSACLNGSGPVLTSKCDGLKVGDIVSFFAEITVTECPADPKEWQQQIQIYPVGINETLTIDLEMLCSCPCENPNHPMYEVASEKCHDHGNYMCGICECNNSYFGNTCECSAASGTPVNQTVVCKADNDTISECNGRGTCVCGICECNKRQNPEEVVSGRFCECDNFSCDRHNSLVCSGPDHGTCNCGTCNCKPGWTGLACDCLASNETCKQPNSDGEICSGHGECECGVCKCKVTNEGRYSGKYCEKCPTCSRRCQDLKDCVQCQMYKTGPLKDEAACAANCTLFVPIGVEKIDMNDEKENGFPCAYYDDDDCRFKFRYTEIDGKIEVYAQQERECPPKVFMLGIVLGVIAAIVLVGLAILLLWKLLTTIHDRREFARFEKERMAAKWDAGENPIYRHATTTFKNPTYAGK